LAAVESVYLQSDLATQIEDSQLNPDPTEAGARVQINLKFKSTSPDISALYDAIQSVYSTLSANDVSARGCYEWQVN
jgi:hypothetical protein